MKLGVAGRIAVVDVDLADTVDVRPFYSDVVYLFEDNSEGADSIAQAWLDCMGE